MKNSRAEAVEQCAIAEAVEGHEDKAVQRSVYVALKKSKLRREVEKHVVEDAFAIATTLTWSDTDIITANRWCYDGIY